ncbi:MAG TPA: DUF6356 family protein [Burkholderiales bacterium]|nr:DUF6356 family protein [Burkholderiales bacterium]
MPHLSFSEHPASVGETYVQHLGSASGFGLRMILGGVACLVHGVLPFAFVSRGSTTISQLYDRMVLNRRRSAAVPALPMPVAHGGPAHARRRAS